jgi:hypothetical protein
MDEERPSKKAKPAGVMCAEIWVKIGDTPPADPSELSFLALDKSSPHQERSYLPSGPRPTEPL